MQITFFGGYKKQVSDLHTTIVIGSVLNCANRFDLLVVLMEYECVLVQKRIKMYTMK